MKRFARLAALLLALSLVLGACGKKNEGFTYSSYLDSNGYWEGVKASDLVELIDYKNIVVPSEEVDARIDDVLDDFPSYDYEKEIEDGDAVYIDFAGSIDGVAFDGGTAQNYRVVIGETAMIDDFIEQLVGHRPGDSFTIEVTFPENYGNEELNGKDAQFDININSIEVRGILSDDYVLANFYETYGLSTVEDLRSFIAEDCALAKLVEESTVESIPENLITYQEEFLRLDLKNYFEQNYSSYGISYEDFIGYMGYESEDDYVEDNRINIEKSARYYLIMQAVLEKENVKLGDSDLRAYFKELGIDDFTDRVEFYGKPYVKLIIMLEKVEKMMRDWVSIG